MKLIRCVQFLLLFLLSFISIYAGAIERVTYYHNDSLGSPIAATDKEGNLLWREEYEPYGERFLKEDTGTNNLWYTGKQEEEAYGINYFGARWYDPSIGRFLAIDPVGFNDENLQSFNRYAYANNSPYGFVDPNGESPLDIGFFIADAIKLAVAINSGNPVAIQSAAGDLAASAIGLASPIPGTGQLLKSAKLAKNIKNATESKRKLGDLAIAGKQRGAIGFKNKGKKENEKKHFIVHKSRKKALEASGQPSGTKPEIHSKPSSRGQRKHFHDKNNRNIHHGYGKAKNKKG